MNKALLVFLISLLAYSIKSARHKEFNLGREEDDNWLMSSEASQGSSKDSANSNVLQMEVVSTTFSQYKDHFTYPLGDKFNQRYWYSDSYWDAEHDGPIFLHFCAEGTGHMVRINDEPARLAREFHGLVIAIEHRYYGESQLFDDWSLPNMELLTHEQALADYAYFIQQRNIEYKEKHEKEFRWIVSGGSYAGALAAWFRYKYPHLAIGAVASSGVVNAIKDFRMYMFQILEDIEREPECKETILELVKYATDVILKGDVYEKFQFKKLMNADMLDDKDFLMYFTDVYVGYIQYSDRRSMCKQIIKLKDYHRIPQLLAYTEVGRKNGLTPSDFTLQNEMNTTIHYQKNMRQWMYQVCTAFGYFQTGDENNPLRWEGLDLAYEATLCKRMFGENLMPDTYHTNALFGSVDIEHHVSNVIFINGGDDPW
jgi:hypothetical protein